MTTAVIYARYSSHNQTEQSIEGQLHDAYAYAERNEYQVIGEYIDRALTGTRDQRPDFQRMIRDAEKHQFDLIIVWKLDRFARNRYDSAIYKARLKKYGVRVVSVMENITDGPEGVILEGILESMAEYYSANLAENVRRGMKENINKGWFCGGNVPLGYRVQDHRLVIDERTAPVAREVFRRYSDGESPSAIAEDLNRRGIRTPRGYKFTLSSFEHMLVNSAYIGKYTFAGQVIDGAADRLIDDDVFRRSCERRQKNKRAPAAEKAVERYHLQGKIFCGHCGAPMIGESGRSHTGAIHQYYTCASRKKKHTCKKKNEKKGFIEWYVVEQTVRYILDPRRIRTIARAVVSKYNEEFSAGEVDNLQRTIGRIDADISKLVDRLLIVPDSAAPAIGQRIEQLQNEKTDAEIELKKLVLAQKIRLTEEQVVAWMKSISGGDLMDDEYRQRIIDVFVNSVYLYDDKVVIFYNIRGGRQTCAVDPPPDPDSLEEGSDLLASGLPSAEKSEPRIVFVRGLIGIVIRR